MHTGPEMATEGPFSWLERWAPEDARAWAAWRRTLSTTTRSRALVPLQAALAGLAALRTDGASDRDDRSTQRWPHARAIEVTLDWSLSLIEACRSSDPRTRGPEAALEALRGSLRQALASIRSTSQEGAFDREDLRTRCGVLLDDLEKNRFFRPAAPLEFCNLDDLVGPEHAAADLQLCNDGQSTAAVVAFLSLLRSHRYLGIADREITNEDGLYRAQVVWTGVCRELLALAELLRVQGVESFPNEPEVAESLATLVTDAVRDAGKEGFPTPTSPGSFALHAERLRNVVRELRELVKRAAKRVRDLATPVAPRPVPRASEPVPRDLSPEIWTFRLIARAFLDKAEAAALQPDGSADRERFNFATEFARHFRKFGPRLAKATGYERRAPLLAAVGVLSNRSGVDLERLGLAAHECERFVQHLDRALDEARRLGAAVFDKRAAAAELLSYLAESSRRTSQRPAAGVFGEGSPRW